MFVVEKHSAWSERIVIAVTDVPTSMRLRLDIRLQAVLPLSPIVAYQLDG